jgi:hypothetical protein
MLTINFYPSKNKIKTKQIPHPPEEAVTVSA